MDNTGKQNSFKLSDKIYILAQVCFTCWHVKEDEMGSACSMNGAKRNAHVTLVGKPEGNRPLGRPVHEQVDNIKMDLREIGYGGMDWLDLAQDRNQWRVVL
jgi:hypothetical protein